MLLVAMSGTAWTASRCGSPAARGDWLGIRHGDRAGLPRSCWRRADRRTGSTSSFIVTFACWRCPLRLARRGCRQFSRAEAVRVNLRLLRPAQLLWSRPALSAVIGMGLYGFVVPAAAVSWGRSPGLPPRWQIGEVRPWIGPSAAVRDAVRRGAARAEDRQPHHGAGLGSCCSCGSCLDERLSWTRAAPATTPARWSHR